MSILIFIFLFDVAIELYSETLIVFLYLFSFYKRENDNYLLLIAFIFQAARNNVLLAVPALLYAINNYLKFVMQVRIVVKLSINKWRMT